MHDPLLEHIIDLAEEETPVETEVTLMVGGMLITGRVIGYERYMSLHALTRDYLQLETEGDEETGEDEAAEDESDDDEAGDALEDEAVFVHLRDARTHAPGQSPGGLAGLYRIALGDVSGFSLVH
ncbi:MAG: hypothetical protein ACOY82_20245 [Pseudomonadota bacterium]